jgi:ribosomal 30S subunit maturation factor RimM
MTIRKTMAAGLVGITLATASGTAMAAQSQGLYSANQLMGADVYAQSNPQQQLGEIKDILFGNGMRIQAFVVQTENKYGLSGKSYVVNPGKLRVQTTGDQQTKNPQYRVTLNTTKQQLSNQPVYSDSWWHKAQGHAENAWQQTKQSAGSAWTQFKNSASNLINGD